MRHASDAVKVNFFVSDGDGNMKIGSRRTIAINLYDERVARRLRPGKGIDNSRKFGMTGAAIKKNAARADALEGARAIKMTATTTRTRTGSRKRKRAAAEAAQAKNARRRSSRGIDRGVTRNARQWATQA